MDLQRKRTIERLAAASGIATAIGGTAYLLTKRHNKEAHLITPQPEILNTDQLEPLKRLLVNRVAMVIICTQYPDRKRVMADLEVTKHQADYGTGYLMHYGLVVRKAGDKSTRIPAHYDPVSELVDTLLDPERFPFKEIALQERLAKRTTI